MRSARYAIMMAALIMNGKYGGNKYSVIGDLEDRDYTCYRARQSFGWKNRRCCHQWEHRVIETEKHTRNRMTRAKRDGGVLFPDE